MPLEDYNICPVHGVIEPQQIIISGPTGGVPFCFVDECWEQLRSKHQMDVEAGAAEVGNIIDEVYGPSGS